MMGHPRLIEEHRLIFATTARHNRRFFLWAFALAVEIGAFAWWLA